MQQFADSPTICDGSFHQGSEPQLVTDSCAGVGIIARYEDDLPLPFQGRIHTELCRRKMIEGLCEARSDECLGHDFRREETSELFRSNTQGIRKVDNDLAVPLLELLRNILMHVMPASNASSLKMPLKLPRYRRNTSTHSTHATRAGAMLAGPRDDDNFTFESIHDFLR